MYRFIMQIIKVALFFFFKRIVVTGKKNLINNGPLIIVGNHPNTFMDPVLIASILPQEVHFLSNGSFTLTLLSQILHRIPCRH